MYKKRTEYLKTSKNKGRIHMKKQNVNFEQKMAMQMKIDLISRIEAIDDFSTISNLNSLIKGIIKNGINKSYVIIEKKKQLQPASKSCL